MLSENDRTYLPDEIPGEDIRRIFGHDSAFNYQVYLNGEGVDGSNAFVQYTSHISEEEAIAQVDRVNEWAEPYRASAGLAMAIDAGFESTAISPQVEG